MHLWVENKLTNEPKCHEFTTALFYSYQTKYEYFARKYGKSQQPDFCKCVEVFWD